MGRIIEGHPDRRFHGTVDGIPYRTDVVGIRGCAVELFPVKGVHTRSDVRRAKSLCKNTWDVVLFYVSFQEEGEPP